MSENQPKKTYYVTTPIYYANGHPHLGNTYTTTIADCLTRFHQFLGYETFFLTGMDEHGDKVDQAAQAAGKTAFDFTTEVSEIFKKAWKELDLNYSHFIRTTDADHKKVVAKILNYIHDKGDIYFGEYGGNYCVGCERFLTDKELVDGKCADHQVPPKFVKEKNYFFRMAKYQDRLIEHIKKNPDFIRPERYKNEVLAMLREPLEDLCISRPKSRLTWGIELPFDKDYVTYVWFDALINYLTGIGYPDGKDFSKFWASCEHLIAKDILKPHGVFWPTMLMAADLPLYQHLNCHGYWITPTGKMSKSLGNVVDPVAVKNQFGMDVFRYFVCREMTFGLDGTFSQETLEARYNADLANNLGNLVSRSLAMVDKYREGIVPKAVAVEDIDKELEQSAVSTLKEVISRIENVEIHRALESLWQLIDAANVYIDRTKPWTLAKEGNNERLDTVLYCQVEVLRVIAGMLTAFMPDTSVKILKCLGYDDKGVKLQQNLVACQSWGATKVGSRVTKGEGLFPRLDNAKKEQDAASKDGNKAKNKETKAKTMTDNPTSENTAKVEDGLISIDDFFRVQLRVGQILEAEKVEKSDKLICLQVDLGPELGKKQILAGIGKHYQAEDLVGRKVAVVANLKPAKLMGMKSEGMLLAASDTLGNLELVNIGAILTAGSVIR